jgi:glycosyltransferase involved in cell wall biosynthesis
MLQWLRTQGAARPVLADPKAARGSPQASLLSRADRARDDRQWRVAADLYREFLTHHPERWDIAVQLGHAHKELGEYETADAAYAMALEGNGADADLHLQIGHLRKLQGRRRDSVTAYARALELDPSLKDACKELAGLGEVALAFRIIDQAPQVHDPITDYAYEIGDMLVYFQNHARVSGIQRVQVELCRHYLDRDDGSHFVTLFPFGFPLKIDRQKLRFLIELLDSDDVTVEKLKDHINSIINNAAVVKFLPSSSLIVLGAFWVMPFAMRNLMHISASGVKIGVYIYDLIPIMNPEFCDEVLVQNFTVAFTQMLFIADFFLTISEATRRDVETACRNIGMQIPARAIPLAHDLQFRAGTDAGAVDWLRRHELDEGYVLVVSTIEARKNHALLFHLWRRLQREHGAALPKLVIVGRAGWRVNDLMAQLRATQHVDGRIVILNDLSNQELTTLYRNCLFTVFPSFVEGWGLPVGESLMFGKPCAASGTSSIPEVGGDLVDYFDPWSLADAERVIGRLLFDPVHRDARAAQIAASFKPRSWAQTAEHFATSCRELAALAKRGGAKDTPLLEPAALYTPGSQLRLAVSGTQRAFAELACPSSDWHQFEPWGVWAARPSASLTFRIEGTAPVDVFLLMQSSPIRPGHAIEVHDGNNPQAKPVTARNGYARLPCRPTPEGRLHVVITTVYSGDVVQLDHDMRDIHAGLIAFGYGSSDVAALTPLERLLEIVRVKS